MAEGELLWEDQLKQARHVPKVFAFNIHQGIEAVYFFLLPHYRERENQFGITRKDHTPRPAYLSLAAAGRILAGAKPLGEIIDPDRPHLKAFHFATKIDGKSSEVTVLWSENTIEKYFIPNQKKLFAIYDMMGRSKDPVSKIISVGNDAVYLVYKSKVSESMKLNPPPDPEIYREGEPCPLVMQPMPLAEQKLIGTSEYMFKPQEEVTFPIMLYNFADIAITTTLFADSNEYFDIRIPEQTITVPKMGRVEARLKVFPGDPPNTLKSQLVKIHAYCKDYGNQLLAMRFIHMRNTLNPIEHISISSTKGTSRWKTASTSGDLQVQAATDGGIRLAVSNADRNNNITAAVDVPVNQRATRTIQGLAYTVKPVEGIGRYEVSFKESSGRSYWGFVFVPDKEQLGDTQHFVVRFETLEETTSPKPEISRPIDPQKIVTVQVGCFTSNKEFTFEVRDLAWVRYE